MTTELEQRVTVDRSVDDCFRYLLDFSTTEQWDPGVYRATKRTPGPPREGTVFDLVISFMGRKLSMEYEFESVEDGEELLLTGRGEGVESRDTISFRSVDGDRCEITLRAELDLKRLPGPTEALARPLLERIGVKAITGLERALTPQEEVAQQTFGEKLKYRALLPAAWDFTERGYLQMEDKGLSHFVDGQTAVVTGPTSGLGKATAKLLARLGARLFLVGRDRERLEESKSEIIAFSGCRSDDLTIIEGDLSEMAQVRRTAEEIQSHTDEIQILVNNAGALFDEHQLTSEGNERTLAVNLLAAFVLTSGLIDQLRAGSGRVINVASGGMYTQALKLSDMQFQGDSFDGAKAYARVKRGLVALTDHWAAQYDSSQVTFNSMHPGWADTSGVKNSLPGFYGAMKSRLRDARMGADTIVWLATSPAVVGESGEFYFDRIPRRKAVFAGTQVSPTERAELVAWLQTRCDFPLPTTSP